MPTDDVALAVRKITRTASRDIAQAARLSRRIAQAEKSHSGA